MAKVIAVTGKGGVGKTTVAALMVRLLVEAGQGPVLAVDADPNLNLNAALGVDVQDTVGDVREEGLDRAASLPGGMAKSDFLRLRVQQALVESKGFDLLAMGRPEGPGCYCFANSILRACVDQIGKQYAYVVMDCEAGLEHLSRRTAGDVDVLVLLSDLSVRGLDTAARVLELVAELETKVGKTVFAFARVRGDVPEELVTAAKQRGLLALRSEVACSPLRGVAPEPLLVPEDPEVAALDAEGRPLARVPADSPALRAVRQLLDEVELAGRA